MVWTVGTFRLERSGRVWLVGVVRAERHLWLERMVWNLGAVWHKRLVRLERTVGTFRLERARGVRLERLVR
jgi:hypothetical protein